MTALDLFRNDEFELVITPHDADGFRNLYCGHQICGVETRSFTAGRKRRPPLSIRSFTHWHAIV